MAEGRKLTLPALGFFVYLDTRKAHTWNIKAAPMKSHLNKNHTIRRNREGFGPHRTLRTGNGSPEMSYFLM